MEAQPQPPSAPPGPGPGSGSGSVSGSGPSPPLAKVPSPVNPQPDPATHYPNGLPRSINGLKGNGVNGSGPTSPAVERPGATAPAQPATSSPAPSAPMPMMTTPASAPTAVTLPPIAAAPLKPIVMYTPSISQPSQPTQPNQHLQTRTPTSASTKIPIVDPPGALSRQRNSPHSSSSSKGFPSPKKEHHLENPKFVDDLSRLTHAMQQSVPAAVRRVIRDNWEKCLLGSEFHHAFLVSDVSFILITVATPFFISSCLSFASLGNVIT
ncbi:hypothetical protein K449DRAFT_273050 [Hypoxylon sp. EC38]|nr:hypothetical protein K449DRAFT_273050 [Hypoxylon sp. EC38]